jgi:hypothetical protein
MLYLALLLSLCQPHVDNTDIRIIEEDGASFVCFTPEDTKKLLQMRLDLPLLELKAQKLEESNVLRDAELVKLRTSNDEMYAQLLDQKTLSKRLEADLNKKNVWYTHPIFWAVVGFTLGGMTYLLIDNLVGDHKLSNMISP